MAALATLSIPLITVNGLRTFGPIAIPLGVTVARLSLDRTVGASPLNGEPSTTQVTISIESSLDGGATWDMETQAVMVGGIIVIKGVQQNASFIQVGPVNGDPADATRLARAVVDSNAAVSIAGTLTLN